jgi:hypothetical protein
MKKHLFPPCPAENYDDPPETKRVWALLATTERAPSYGGCSRGGFVHLRFSFVSVPGYHGAGQASAANMRNEVNSPFYHLEITSQGDQYRPDELYGWGLEYRSIHSLDLREAQQYTRFLERTQRGLDKLKGAYGSVHADFPAWVVRVATVLKVRYLIKKVSAGQESTYAEGGYEVTHLYQKTNKGLVDKLDGEDLLWRVRRLQHQLWTETDRKRAAELEAQRAAEKAQQQVAEEQSA